MTKIYNKNELLQAISNTGYPCELTASIDVRARAFDALRIAEEEFYLYASACGIGDEKSEAFVIYKAIQNALGSD